MKDDDLGEPTSFLWPCIFGLHSKRMSNKQGYCRQLQKYVRIQDFCRSYGKLPVPEKSDANISSWSYDMEGHAKKCVERYCDLANKTTQQLYKVATSCMDDHQFKGEENESVGELSTVCSQIVLKSLYFARIGRPDILWSVNKLARAVTKWTKSCDKRLARLIPYIHHTSGYRQFCNAGNTAQQCRLRLFQDSDFAGDLEDSKSTSGGILCIFGSHTFVPTSWMCKKQTSVSPQLHRSGNHFSWCRVTHGRYSCSHSLGFGDLNISFHTEQDWTTQGRARRDPSAIVKPNMHNSIPVKHTNVIPTNIDHIPSNTTHSGPSAMLYVFEDNEAVIKMISKGRSPTMRHVSRTHRVSLDWLYLDPKIPKSVTLTPNTNSQTCWLKGIQTRDEWNNLFHLLTISYFSSTWCTKNFSLISYSTMAKRMHDQEEEEERVVSKSRPAAMNLSSLMATNSSTTSSPIASKKSAWKEYQPQPSQ